MSLKLEHENLQENSEGEVARRSKSLRQMALDPEGLCSG